MPGSPTQPHLQGSSRNMMQEHDRAQTIVSLVLCPSSSSSLCIWNQGSSYLIYWQLGAWFQICRELEFLIWLSYSWHKTFQNPIFAAEFGKMSRTLGKSPSKQTMRISFKCSGHSFYTTWQVFGSPKLPRTLLEVWWGWPKDSKFFTFSREPKFSQDDNIIIQLIPQPLCWPHINIYMYTYMAKLYMPSWEIIP